MAKGDKKMHLSIMKKHFKWILRIRGKGYSEQIEKRMNNSEGNFTWIF